VHHLLYAQRALALELQLGGRPLLLAFLRWCCSWSSLVPSLRGEHRQPTPPHLSPCLPCSALPAPPALQDPSIRSHTLVFRLPSASSAKAAVDALAALGVVVDTRRGHVRLGFGANHSAADVDALLCALSRAAAAGGSAVP